MNEEINKEIDLGYDEDEVDAIGKVILGEEPAMTFWQKVLLCICHPVNAYRLWRHDRAFAMKDSDDDYDKGFASKPFELRIILDAECFNLPTRKVVTKGKIIEKDIPLEKTEVVHHILKIVNEEGAPVGKAVIDGRTVKTEDTGTVDRVETVKPSKLEIFDERGDSFDPESSRQERFAKELVDALADFNKADKSAMAYEDICACVAKHSGCDIERVREIIKGDAK